jgi:hypothetical protein
LVEKLHENEIRALVIEHVEAHDRDEHDGELCEEHRTGLIAWLAHSVGMRPTEQSMVAFMEALLEYEHDHQLKHERTNGDGHAH